MTNDYIRFSSLDRIAVCSASWAESKGLPSVGSEAANFGTAGHKIYETMTGIKRFLSLDECIKIAAQFGVGARGKELHDAIKEHGHLPTGRTEVPVAITWDSPDIPSIKGTLDNVVDDDVMPVITDFKFQQARGHAAKVGERIQVPSYAQGYALEHGSKNVKAVVRNPLMGLTPKGVSERIYDKVEIAEGIEFLRELAMGAAHQGRLKQDKRSYTPSEHCGFCPARSTCPAIRTQLQAVATVSEQELSLNIEQLPALVQYAKDLGKRAKAVEDFAKATLKMTGDIVGTNGLSLVLTKTMRAPSVSAKAIMEWMDANGHSDVLLSLKAELEDRPKVEIPTMRVKKTKKEIAS